MSGAQIIVIVAVAWLVAAVLICVLWKPVISPRLRRQHRPVERDDEDRR